MLAFQDNRAVARCAARDEERQKRSDRLKRGYKSAMKKYPKIIANLAQ